MREVQRYRGDAERQVRGAAAFEEAEHQPEERNRFVEREPEHHRRELRARHGEQTLLGERQPPQQRELALVDLTGLGVVRDRLEVDWAGGHLEERAIGKRASSIE